MKGYRLYFSSWWAFALATFCNCALAQSQPVQLKPIVKQNKIIDWTIQSSQNFDVYCYDSNTFLAQYALYFAESKLKEMERLVDFRLSGKSQIILFNRFADYKHSNFNTKEAELAREGFNYIIENKIIAVASGRLADLEKQIKYGIAEILISELIYGGSFQERIQANSILYIPKWHYKGLLHYLSEEWNTELDGQMREAIDNKSLRNLNLLSEELEILAGHSFWHFVVQTHGKRVISEILYSTRTNKGYENAILFLFKVNMKGFLSQWYSYFADRYQQEDFDPPFKDALTLPKVINKAAIVDFKMSENGKNILISSIKNGVTDVLYYDVALNKTTRLLRQKTLANRFNAYEKHPLVFWHKDGKRFGIVSFYENKLQMQLYDNSLSLLRIIDLNYFDLIQSIDHDAKTDQYLISGVINGQSDLFVIDQKGKIVQQLTNDYYDDVDARFGIEKDVILFASNRNCDVINPETIGLDSLLKIDKSLDIYLLDLKHTGNDLKRITNTPGINENKPFAYQNSFIGYLSENNGIANFYTSLATAEFDYSYLIKNTDTLFFDVPLQLDNLVNDPHLIGLDSNWLRNLNTVEANNRFKDKIYHYALSNFNRNITHIYAFEKANIEYLLCRYKGKYRLMQNDISEDVKTDAKYIKANPTSYRELTGKQVYYTNTTENSFLSKRHPKDAQTIPIQVDTFSQKRDTLAITYFFQTGFPYDSSKRNIKKFAETQKILIDSKSRKYAAQIFTDYYETNAIDNGLFKTNVFLYDIYSENFTRFNSYLAKAEIGLSDLLNNHYIKAGLRIPYAFYGSDFFVNYQNKKQRIHFGADYFRQARLVESYFNEGGIRRLYLSQLAVNSSYTFYDYAAAGLEIFTRSDKQIESLTDDVAKTIPDIRQNWFGFKFTLHYDKFIKTATNAMEGTRGHLYFQQYLNSANRNNNMYAAGWELRYYKPLWHHIIWANRFAGAFSGGRSRMLYRVGSVENEIFSEREQLNEEIASLNYTLESMVNGIRGFNQNVRNGSSYAFVNTEIRTRFPLYYFLRMSSSGFTFFRDLQFAVFMDVASAWNGFNPFQEQHYNTKIDEQGGVKITVNYYNNPFIASGGYGLRTRLFGYPIKFDVAHGFRNGRVEKRMFHFALGFDF